GYRLKDGATGAVTLIQRFGSALNLNIHFHILFLDGVYVYRDNRPPRFQRVKAPDKSELEELVQLISQRVGRCLERQGLLEQDTESAWLELKPADDTDAMPHLLGSSVSYRIAVGPQQGRKAFMIRTIRPLDRPDAGLERVAKANGFSLHAGVSCEGHQKEKRERLCRYISRPTVAVPRLSLSSTGKVVYTLKTPYRDGTTQVAFEPVDFIARLAALVPKPRINLTRYHGVLAPNHRWRRLVTPAKRGKRVKPIASTEVRSPAERHAAMTWAQRLKRVFNIDIEVCSRCGGSVRVIACIEDQDVIDRILAHLRDKEKGTPTLPHLAPPTRAPPEALPLFAGKDSASSQFNQQGSH
ncbi:MAG: transposase, partial [Marinobacter alexandrii]|uniref:transposase n=1 Tax=Marinobacter alexandrii TaxID=2570351 RepID=UPI00329A0F5F